MVTPLKIDLPGLLIERTRAGSVFYRVRTEKDKAKRVATASPTRLDERD